MVFISQGLEHNNLAKLRYAIARFKALGQTNLGPEEDIMDLKMMTAKRRGGVLEGLGVINPFLRLIFSVLFFCLQGVEEMFWRDYNKSFLGLLSFFGQTRKCSQRMRRCFGGTGCNKSLRSTELPGRR